MQANHRFEGNDLVMIDQNMHGQCSGHHCMVYSSMPCKYLQEELSRCMSKMKYTDPLFTVCFWVGKNMISIDLPKHIRAKCSGPAAVFAISSWRTRRLCASCKQGGGRVVLGRKK